MGTRTTIAWCHHTFSPWRGCAKVSPGCANCYAEKQSKRNPAVLGTWGPDGTRPVGSDAYWRQPLAWNRAALKQQECPHHSSAGPDDNHRCDGCDARIITRPVPGARPDGLVRRTTERPRVFCASLADVFEDRPDLAVPRDRLFETIGETPNLDWLLLTKRPENIERLMWPKPTEDTPVPYLGGGDYLPNVWLGTTVEDQQRADERIPHLLAVQAAVRFLSVEPLLGPVNLAPYLPHGCRGCNHPGNLLPAWNEHGRCSECDGTGQEPAIDWVIVGGESGPRARPCDVAWIRDVVRQCREAGVKCFTKQLGARPFDGEEPDHDPNGADEPRWLRLRDSKGGDPAEWPQDLRVREVPGAGRTT